MAESGDNKSSVGPPVAGRKAASGGAGASPETRRGEPVSNGSCGVSDTVRRVQNESGCESPTWESAGSDAAPKAIPRRSSLIKVGHRFHRGGKTAHLAWMYMSGHFQIKCACTDQN